MIQLTDTLYTVEVPKDATSIDVKNKGVDGYFRYATPNENIRIPYKGNYTILGEVKLGMLGNINIPDVNFNLDGIVEEDSNFYFKNYMSDNIDANYASPQFSFKSLLQSKGCILTTENKFIILKLNE